MRQLECPAAAGACVLMMNSEGHINADLMIHMVFMTFCYCTDWQHCRYATWWRQAPSLKKYVHNKVGYVAFD